ncbi:Hypothetical protein Bdt_3375 [Bdellovibrio bacteriovorus str. Tiberius]|uniref:Uncharacterized protein n=1 Tax=Bdellovibrio bacteriovorus str. Tiberius TaxID=1069642 RepID=K7Z1U5_BDEBC|nr:Hypothetical protein Bdt_3375 [Bdellovibrio bacteriovorus str. Tiberius]
MKDRAVFKISIERVSAFMNAGFIAADNKESVLLLVVPSHIKNLPLFYVDF